MNMDHWWHNTVGEYEVLCGKQGKTKNKMGGRRT